MNYLRGKIFINKSIFDVIGNISISVSIAWRRCLQVYSRKLISVKSTKKIFLLVLKTKKIKLYKFNYHAIVLQKGNSTYN